jgi:hypothetical protein
MIVYKAIRYDAYACEDGCALCYSRHVWRVVVRAVDDGGRSDLTVNADSDADVVLGRGRTCERGRRRIEVAVEGNVE